MSVLDTAREHFAARETQSIEIPEWRVTVFYRTPNASTWAKVLRESKGDVIEQSARLVALCAMNEAGERLFAPLDYKTLMIEADPAIVARIAAAISGGARIDVDAAEGN